MSVANELIKYEMELLVHELINYIKLLVENEYKTNLFSDTQLFFNPRTRSDSRLYPNGKGYNAD